MARFPRAPFVHPMVGDFLVFGRHEIEDVAADQFFGMLAVFGQGRTDKYDPAGCIQTKYNVGDGLDDGIQIRLAVFHQDQRILHALAGSLLSCPVFEQHEKNAIDQDHRRGQTVVTGASAGC